MKTKIKIYLLIITAALITAGFFINAFVAAKVLPHDETLEFDFSGEDDQPVSLRMEQTKDWLEDGFFAGGQYDFMIVNNLGQDIDGWAVTLPLTHDLRHIAEDQIWNVSFEQTIDTLTVTSLDFTSEIKDGHSQGFGMILVGDEPYRPHSATMTYHVTYHATALPSFTVLLLLALGWLLWLSATMSEIRVLRQTASRERHDKEIILQTMGTFTSFIDAKDPYTKGHSQRVATVAAELARRMKLDDKTVNYVYYAGILHDAGKIGVPDHILKKVGILTPEEYRIIKTHATIGGQMLEDFTSIKGIREGALYHHERYDGNGYPEGKKGEEIPLFGRIICVADTYDAMARDRCYRKHLSKETMLSEFQTHAGKQFDPKIAALMVEMIEDGTAERITEDL